MKHLIKLMAAEDVSLPKNTIVLPSKIYSDIVKNEMGIIIAHPIPISYSRLRSLGNSNILESSELREDECRLSHDLIISMGFDLDFEGDVISVITCSKY